MALISGLSEQRDSNMTKLALMKQLQALIFDVDGTLAETERDGHRVAFNRAFAAAGLDWHWTPDRYGELLSIAGGKERIHHYIQQSCSGFRPPDKLATDLSAWIAALHAAKTAHYQQLLQEGIIPLRPGVNRLIQTARQQGIRLAIATTSALENVLALLETAIGSDALHWFEVIAAGDIVPAKKPAPDIYFYVLQALNLEAQDCLVIEDSDQGLQAALQAGLTTVVTLNDYTRGHDLSGATLVLNHLGEPEHPFEVIAGDAGSATYLDLALADRLLQSAKRND